MPHEPISDVNSPLTPEEQDDLIPNLATREERFFLKAGPR